MKPIYISLTRKGDLNKAIKVLKDYKKSLMDRSEIFVRRLADLGVNVAMMTLATKGQGDASRDAQFAIDFTVEGEKIEGILSITSEPKETEDGRTFYPHLAWEFGAGNAFNGMTSPNPKAKDLKMGPGTFPGQDHVPVPGWWYYRDKYGEAVRSYGTQATMPMYKASIEMIESIERIAKEVFKNG